MWLAEGSTRSPVDCVLDEAPGCELLRVPQELFRHLASAFVGSAAPVARLSATCRGSRAFLVDGDGRLRVRNIFTSSLAAIEQLGRASPTELEVICVDLSGEKREKLCVPHIECAIRKLGDVLVHTSRLRVLVVRMAAYTSSMERLRLGREAWGHLTGGLASLAAHQTLQSLELTSIAIKASWAAEPTGFTKMPSGALTDAGARAVPFSAAIAQGPPSLAAGVGLPSCGGQGRSGGATSGSLPAPSLGSSGAYCSSVRRPLTRAASSPTRTWDSSGVCARRSAAESQADASNAAKAPSFLEALGRMDSLEELALTHNEIFQSTAELLRPIVCKLKRLRKLDLARNHISRQHLATIRESLPSQVELRGERQQTFFFY